MVLHPPTAPEGQASAPWLSELWRWLHLGHNGVIVLVRDAQPARLRELVEFMEAIEPGFRFTIRASDIMECEPGELVLLPLRQQDFDWLNLNRPQFAQRRIRAVLWADASTSDAFRFKAPDLHDWVSHFVHCPSGVPGFALGGLRVGLRWWPGVLWRGEGLEMALEHTGIRDVIELDPAEQFENLVSKLSTARSSPIRWLRVTSGRGLWRARWSLARAGHHGFNVIDDASISCPGWLEVDTRQLELFTAVEELEQAGVPDAAKLAARLELEPGPIDDSCGRSKSRDASEPHHDVVGQAARLLAPPHVQRTLHDDPAVLEARRELAQTMRRAPRSRTWSRAELSVFASLERDRRAWPDWHDLSVFRWEIEHLLRTGGTAEHRQSIVDFFLHAGEQDIERFLASDWNLEPSSNAHDRARARDAWFDRAAGSAEIPAASEHQLTTLMKLAEALGWDVDSVRRTFAQLLRRLVANEDVEELTDWIPLALDAASLQLGSEDPDYAMLCRIAGVAFGAAGHFSEAFLPLQHAWNRLHGFVSFRDSLTVELALVLVWLGRFVEAIEMFELVPALALDEDATRAYQYALLAAAAPMPVELGARTSYQPSDAAAYFERRLLEIVSGGPAAS